MNSKGHLFISIAKSAVRIGACGWALVTDSVIPLAVGFLGAEVLGIAEELVDKRQFLKARTATNLLNKHPTFNWTMCVLFYKPQQLSWTAATAFVTLV